MTSYKQITHTNPYLLGQGQTAPISALISVHAHAKGGGGGSSKEYERQLQEQREAREKAEREAETLKQNQELTAAERAKRAQASYLTGGEGLGDDEFTTRKSYLGSGN